MKKMNHLRGHCTKNKELMSVIPLRYWEKITLNLSYLYDKIKKGEFVELPRRVQTKMRKCEIKQVLQILKQKAFVKKNHFSQSSMLNYFIRYESNNNL